jgi:molybdenum cofactor biosynthesis enzyme MoaA
MTELASTPSVPLAALDQLWFQVAGTVCNLRCTHCFINCSPDNHSFWFMKRSDVMQALEESVELGVKEYYFTGGEPFMNRDMVEILSDTLEFGPATVLTNATLLTPKRTDRLAISAGRSPYSLEFRVSIDGVNEETNDAIRGTGAFGRAMAGVNRLVTAGFLPIITAMQSWPDEEHDRVLASFRNVLASFGYERARIKVIPPLRMGAEVTRSRGYAQHERVTHEMLCGYNLDQLLCTRARLVTARGVYACPILLDYESAHLANTLADAVRREVSLQEQACYTCYMSGAICANISVSSQDLSRGTPC